MSSISVARELDSLGGRKLKDLLETGANLQQRVLTTRLAASPRPETNSVEALAHIDHHTHDLVVALILKCLADGSKLGVEPKFVDVDQLLVLERIRPLSAVLVLRILPLGADTLLEEVVIGLEAQVGAGSDVVLPIIRFIPCVSLRRTYVDTPELLNSIKRHDFFEQIIPVVAF